MCMNRLWDLFGLLKKRIYIRIFFGGRSMVKIIVGIEN